LEGLFVLAAISAGGSSHRLQAEREQPLELLDFGVG
jgi:hypothetical protein